MENGHQLFSYMFHMCFLPIKGQRLESSVGAGSWQVLGSRRQTNRELLTMPTCACCKLTQHNGVLSASQGMSTGPQECGSAVPVAARLRLALAFVLSLIFVGVQPSHR